MGLMQSELVEVLRIKKLVSGSKKSKSSSGEGEVRCEERGKVVPKEKGDQAVVPLKRIREKVDQAEGQLKKLKFEEGLNLVKVGKVESDDLVKVEKEKDEGGDQLVSDFSFFSEDGEYILFFHLPQKSNEFHEAEVYHTPLETFLTGNVGGVMQTKLVVSWKFKVQNQNRRYMVKGTSSNWLTLLTPAPAYEKYLSQSVAEELISMKKTLKLTLLEDNSIFSSCIGRGDKKRQESSKGKLKRRHFIIDDDD